MSNFSESGEWVSKQSVRGQTDRGVQNKARHEANEGVLPLCGARGCVGFRPRGEGAGKAQFGDGRFLLLTNGSLPHIWPSAVISW